LALGLAALALAPRALADERVSTKFEATAGRFDLNAKTSEGNTALGNFGLYRAAFRLEFVESWEFGVAYSLYVVGTESPDLGFGPDLSIRYFPLTGASARRVETDTAQVVSYEILRPYVAATFSQRQFQSIQSSYAGGGLTLGSEIVLDRKFYVVGEGSYSRLKGPLDSHIDEWSVTGGIGMQL
jgi:hypothetical protein